MTTFRLAYHRANRRFRPWPDALESRIALDGSGQNPFVQPPSETNPIIIAPVLAPPIGTQPPLMSVVVAP